MQLWVEEEQLRLDGVESWLTDTLGRLEEEQCRVDGVEAVLGGGAVLVEAPLHLIEPGLLLLILAHLPHSTIS